MQAQRSTWPANVLSIACLKSKKNNKNNILKKNLPLPSPHKNEKDTTKGSVEQCVGGFVVLGSLCDQLGRDGIFHSVLYYFFKINLKICK